jgi:hypothetical protein
MWERCLGGINSIWSLDTLTCQAFKLHYETLPGFRLPGQEAFAKQRPTPFTFEVFVHVCVKRVRQMRLANHLVFPLENGKLHRIARLLLQLITSLGW